MTPAVSGSLLLCLVLLYHTALCRAEEDYCSLSCSKGPHTMCQFKQESIASKCYKYNKTLNIHEADDIVKIHNTIRNDVASGKMTGQLSGQQPQAANMMQLVWDEELAAVAQRWAYQCIFDHDLCRRVRRFDVGQNIATWTGGATFTSQNVYSTIEMWSDEVDQLKKGIIQNYARSESDHYTQLVWAQTGAVGCGTSIYMNEGQFTHLLVCNYGPAGNVPGMPVYTEGPPCSACPKGTSCSSNFTGLCFSPDYAKTFQTAHAEQNSVCGTTVLLLLLVHMAGYWLFTFQLI